MARGLALFSALALAVLTAAAAGASTTARTFVIEGRGWGHGVGMSQWGAEGFALHGWSYREILAHYYPGTRLDRVAGRTVRVLLAGDLDRVRISSAHAFKVTAHGRTKVRRRAVVVTPGSGRLTFELGASPLSVNGTAYRGTLVVFGNGTKLAVVNVLPLERYLRGVVPWEMPHRWSAQALEAQSVAARSYALATLHPSQTFDLFADARDQEYGGIRAETPQTNVAVGATAGQILSYRGRVALAYYCSTSGGRTEAGSAPYLASVPDPYDGLSPHHHWGPLRFAARQLASRLHLPGVTGLQPIFNGSGRVSAVRVSWRKGGIVLSGSDFQAGLDLPSTWFWVQGGRAAPGPGSERVTRTTLPGADGDWPSGKAGWTVVLQALPTSAGSALAQADARKASRAGLPRVGVLFSDDFASLRPGYRVVFSGVYGSAGAAQAAARAAAHVYPEAYARLVLPMTGRP